MNERHYLFLIRRKAEWPRAWDSLINRCHHDLEHDVDDDTWFEEEYEKDELINRLPSGREIYSVKTPEDFAAEVAAEKAEKVAAKKKKEHAAAEKASAKAAKAAENPGKNSSAPASTAQRLAGNFKRKRVAPAKTGKG
ncbi:hypothetical protein MHU86_19381 [Fragilaria crotonensis]|nr:hypothetical protein MHU86_19381 [Fragilaria crotonensis]